RARDRRLAGSSSQLVPTVQDHAAELAELAGVEGERREVVEPGGAALGQVAQGAAQRTLRYAQGCAEPDEVGGAELVTAASSDGQRHGLVPVQVGARHVVGR